MNHTARTLRAASVLAARGPISPGEVVVEGGVVAHVGPLVEGPAPEPGSVVSPGFVDLQVNGIAGVDVATAEGDEWATIGRSLLSQGVTTWCPTLTSAPLGDLSRAIRRIEAALSRNSEHLLGPLAAGIHVEGPFLSVPGAHPAEHLIGEVEARWIASLPDFVRAVTLAPELPGALEAVESLARRGVLVSLGHSRCSFAQAREAARLGARMVTHLGNAMGPFHQREPGLLGAALADPGLCAAVIADLVHVHPALVEIAFEAKGPSGVALVTDAVAWEAGHIGPVVLDARREPSSSSFQVARLADGTLAGSVLTMDQAIANVVGAAGLTLHQAVQAASGTPARLLGLFDRGVIAPGRRADLVELRVTPAMSLGAVGPPGTAPVASGSLGVERVWIAGELAWTRA